MAEPRKSNKSQSWEKLDVNQKRQEFWEQQDINPDKDFIKRGQRAARYRHYGKLLMANMDQDKLGNLTSGLTGSAKDRNKYADKYGKENEDFFIPSAKFKDYITNEDDLNDFLTLREEFESDKGISTDGTRTDKGAFGARSVATIFGGHKVTVDDPRGTRSYDIDYTKDGGYTNTLSNLEVDRYNPIYDRVAEMKDNPIVAPTDRTKVDSDLATKPKLVNGLDNTPLLDSTPLLGGAFNAADHMASLDTAKDFAPSLEATKNRIKPPKGRTKSPKKGGAAISGATMSGAGQLLGGAAGLIDSRTDGTSSVAEAVLTGAGSGAAAGAALGPIGATVGGVIGGAVSGISTSIKNKSITGAAKKASLEEQQARTLSTMQPAQNTQAPMYEFGTAAAEVSQPVEVEKDEVVLRKNSLGKFYIAADFGGGKTHEQGGEDYIMEKGDIVFPGNKRGRIKTLLSNNNHAGIESERMRLPRDVPQNEKLRFGNRGTDLEPGEIGVNIPSAYFDFMAVGKEAAIEEVEASTKAKATTTQAVRSAPGTKGAKADEAGTVLGEDDKDYVYNSPSWLTNSAAGAPRDEAPVFESAAKSVLDNASDGVKTSTDLANEASANKKKSISDSISEGMRYAPAITNIMKGMGKPETADRRFLSPDEYNYKDSSGYVRRESDVQKRVDSDNASRFSGGSAQMARAGKAMAGAAHSGRLQQINAHESARADQMEGHNVGVRNQTKQINLNLASKYDDMDAQNRSMIDSYFDQGVYDVGKIGSQIRKDKAMDKSQDIALNMLARDDFSYDSATESAMLDPVKAAALLKKIESEKAARARGRK